MKFSEVLNGYIEQLDCPAKAINEAAGISGATISRYRSGERVPAMNSPSFEKLCETIAVLAQQRGINNITAAAVRDSFISCSDFISIDREQLRLNFNSLISVLNFNISNLCQQTNYDVSTVFRIRNGERQPADPEQFASAVASYAALKCKSEDDIAILAELTKSAAAELTESSSRAEIIKKWLLEGKCAASGESSVAAFLNKLDEFDLNEYIKAIHFDEMKVPSLPFQLPTSKYYYGLREMMESELDFLKATVLSKSAKPVTLYSDMPMAEMAKDPDFPKKWMYGMALMLKKGLHLNNIHNLNRPFDEMMLGLESWIPMYMTGQISPFYFKGTQSGIFHNFLRVSGAAALSGEAVNRHHSEGRYYLSKTKEDISYYSKRAAAMLENADPLMDIYRSENKGNFNAFILAGAKTAGSRRGILSAPPIYTIDERLLSEILNRRGLPNEEKSSILKYAAAQRELSAKILAAGSISDEIPKISEKEFELHPIALSLSGMFYDKDIKYSYEEYCEHLENTKRYSEENPSYTAEFTPSNPFRNLQITVKAGQWAMISKGNAPAIHFVIHHPRLRSAIENFVPPMVEE